MSQEKSKPVKSFKAGTIQSSIWRKETQEDGQTVVRYSVRIQKQYKNDEGKWQNSDYYFPDELPRVQLVAAKAFEFIALKESKTTEEPTTA
jgi:hypothetical protein